MGLTGDIYRKAQKVIVWLGGPPVNFASAVKAVQDFTSAESEQVAHPDPELNSWRQPLKSILQRRWWSRCWTVQEVALSDNVVVKSGPHELQWD